MLATVDSGKLHFLLKHCVTYPVCVHVSMCVCVYVCVYACVLLERSRAGQLRAHTTRLHEWSLHADDWSCENWRRGWICLYSQQSIRQRLYMGWTTCREFVLLLLSLSLCLSVCLSVYMSACDFCQLSTLYCTSFPLRIFVPSVFPVNSVFNSSFMSLLRSIINKL